MSTPRDTRRCALQVLYQLDAANAECAELLRESLDGSPGDEQDRRRGIELARAAWELRETADSTVAELTPDWPTHRQPVLDRNILRLAFYEMTSGVTPPKVAINEAVELAREFSTEKSPLFVNGVLDKIFKSLRLSSGAANDVH